MGDQLVVLSDAVSPLHSYLSSRYIHPATCISADDASGIVTFDRPITFGGFACSIVPLKDLAAREIHSVPDNLFFWSGRIYGPGRLESEYHSLWSDSAMVDAEVTGITTHARRSPAYGNLIAGSRFHKMNCYCSEAFTEFSQGSQFSAAFDLTLIYKPTLSDHTTWGGLNFGGDHARGIEAYNLSVDMRGMPGGGAAVLGLSLAQDCWIRDIAINVSTRGINQPLIQIAASQAPSADFTFSNNLIERVAVDGVSSGYFVYLNGDRSDHYWGNSVRDVGCYITLTGSGGYAIYVKDCTRPNSVRNIDCNGQGRLRIDSRGRQTVHNINTGYPPIGSSGVDAGGIWRSHDVRGVGSTG